MESLKMLIENPLSQKNKAQIKPDAKKIKKHSNKKGLVKRNKDNPKKELIKEEKNFFTLLISSMVKIRKERGKNKKTENQNNKLTNIKNLKTKNRKISDKKVDNVKFDIFKNKNKTVKTDMQKIAIKNIKSDSKNNLKNIKNKLQEKTDFKPETKKTKEIKSEIKPQKAKVDISRIENIKVDAQNREIKIELLKNNRTKQSLKRTTTERNTMIDEIVKLVKTGDSSGNKIFRIHLEPPELGKVYIRLSFSTDKKLEMKIYVQKTDVQHYIASGMEHLKTSVENLGFKFDNPVVQTMSEFNAGTNQKEGKEEKSKKLRFKVLSSNPFEDKELKDEYYQVMDYLQGRVDIRV